MIRWWNELNWFIIIKIIDAYSVLFPFHFMSFIRLPTITEDLFHVMQCCSGTSCSVNTRSSVTPLSMSSWALATRSLFWMTHACWRTEQCNWTWTENGSGSTRAWSKTESWTSSCLESESSCIELWTEFGMSTFTLDSIEFDSIQFNSGSSPTSNFSETSLKRAPKSLRWLMSLVAHFNLAVGMSVSFLGLPSAPFLAFFLQDDSKWWPILCLYEKAQLYESIWRTLLVL